MENIFDTLTRWSDYEKEIKNHSSRWYRYALANCFFKRVIARWKNSLEEIELIDILDYLVYYRTTPIKRKCHHLWKFPTRNAEYNVVSSLRMFFRFCNLIWLRLKFNREQIPIFKQDDIKRPPMSKEDYNLLHSAIRRYNDKLEIILRDELLFEIPRETGLRRTELTRLKFSDFHNDNRQCRVLVKGNRYESVFYSERLQRKVFEYEKLLNEKYKLLDIEYIFISLGQKDKWKPFNQDVLWKRFKRYVNKLKSEWLIPEDKRLTLHMERHSFAMKCVYSWLSQQATTQLMRHKDPKITLHYYHMNDTRLLNQYDCINQ